MMKNKYETFGGTTTIFWTSKKTLNNFEIFIDAEDLAKILSIGYSIYCKLHKKFYYPVITRRVKKESEKTKVETHCLHSFLIDCPVGYHTDHINNNTMDNRKENLRIIKHKDNMRNRKSKNSNNKSGYRNVSLIDGRYIVQLQVEGKNTRLGSFADVHEAGEFAEQMREKYYGNYKGKN